MQTVVGMEARGGMKDSLLNKCSADGQKLSWRTPTFRHDASLKWCRDKGKRKMRSNYKIIRVPIFNFVKDLSFRRDFTVREWEERQEKVEYMKKRAIPDIERCKRYRQK